MSDLSQKVIRHIPFLRRYARALTGTQERGDFYVKNCLERLLEGSGDLNHDLPTRLQLFKFFHEALALTNETNVANAAGADASVSRLQRHLQLLPSRERQVLLLSTIEGFSTNDVAFILGLEEGEAGVLLEQAKNDLMKQARTTVLVIEDEPVIAFDIAGIVTEMGHRVVATASTKDEAVALARAQEPGLILADIQLDDGSSGIDAVQDILAESAENDVPVVFVTAFPERLLTGEKAEPTFLVTKPFEPDVLKITIAQALYANRDSERSRAAS
ncbi:MAG: response regulator [Pseudomonadota bacterium]